MKIHKKSQILGVNHLNIPITEFVKYEFEEVDDECVLVRKPIPQMIVSPSFFRDSRFTKNVLIDFAKKNKEKDVKNMTKFVVVVENNMGGKITIESTNSLKFFDIIQNEWIPVYALHAGHVLIDSYSGYCKVLKIEKNLPIEIDDEFYYFSNSEFFAKKWGDVPFFLNSIMVK